MKEKRSFRGWNSWWFIEISLSYTDPANPTVVSCWIGSVEDWLLFGADLGREAVSSLGSSPVSFSPGSLPLGLPTFPQLCCCLWMRGGRSQGRDLLFCGFLSPSGVVTKGRKIGAPHSPRWEASIHTPTPLILAGLRKPQKGPPPPVQRQQLS